MLTLLLLTFIALVLPLRPSGEDPVLAAARKRQAAVRTLEIELKESKFRLEGSPSVEVLAEESTYRFVIDGNMVRGEQDSREVVHGDTPRRIHHVTVLDGSLMKYLNVGGAATNQPVGSIDIASQLVSTFIPLPIRMAYCAFVPKFTFDFDPIDRVKATGAVETVDGSACREYRLESTSYWFDPEKDFLLRRVKRGRAGQIDIRYRNDKTLGWAPAGWTETREMIDGTFRLEVEVLRLEFNRPQAANQFDLAFPPGTEFVDLRERKWYHVQPDGSLREGPLPPWHLRNRWLSYAMLGSLLAVVAVLLAMKSWRMKRTRSAPAKPGIT